MEPLRLDRAAQCLPAVGPCSRAECLQATTGRASQERKRSVGSLGRAHQWTDRLHSSLRRAVRRVWRGLAVLAKIFRNERSNFPADRFDTRRCNGSAPRRRPIGRKTCRSFEIIAPCARNLCCPGSRNGRCIVLANTFWLLLFISFTAGCGTCPHDVDCRRVVGQRSKASDSGEAF
jgi:hypothetical protein